MDPQKDFDSPSQGGDVQDNSPSGAPAQGAGDDSFAGSGSGGPVSPQPAATPLFPSSEETAETEAPANSSTGQVTDPATTSADVVPTESAGPAPTGMPQADAEQSPSSASVTPLGIPASPMMSKPARQHKKGLVVGLIVAITAGVLLLSGGAAAAYYYMSNKPENVLKQALANSFDTANTKTARFSGSVTVSPADTDMDFKANFEGASDSQSGAMELTANMDALVTKLTIDARSTDGKTLYLKAGGLNGLPQLLAGMAEMEAADEGQTAAEEGEPLFAEDDVFAMYAPLLGALNDQWIEINESMVSQAFGQSNKGVLSESDRQKLKEAYQKHSFLTIKEKLPDEDIKGAKCYHYKLGIDKAQLKSFAAAIKQADLEAWKLSDDELRSFNESVDKADLDAFGLDLWIAKRGKMIRQTAFSFVQDNNKLDVRVTIESYNEPVQVEKPANAKSLLEIMGEFMSGASVPTGLVSPSQYEIQGGISL